MRRNQYIFILLDTFQREIRENDGHKHLYDKFHEVIKRLDEESACYGCVEEEVTKCIHLLLHEARCYSGGIRFYPVYALRCHKCTTLLTHYITDETLFCEIKKMLGEQMDEFIVNGVIVWMSDEDFDEFSEPLVKGTAPQNMLLIIRTLFAYSDSGMRPHTKDDERLLYRTFLRGYNLAMTYLKRSHDYWEYAAWFQTLHPIHVANILGSCYDSSSDKINEISTMIIDVLNKQMSMLEDWKSKVPESFKEHDCQSILDKCKKLKSIYGIN